MWACLSYTRCPRRRRLRIAPRIAPHNCSWYRTWWCDINTMSLTTLVKVVCKAVINAWPTHEPGLVWSPTPKSMPTVWRRHPEGPIHPAELGWDLPYTHHRQSQVACAPTRMLPRRNRPALLRAAAAASQTQPARKRKRDTEDTAKAREPVQGWDATRGVARQPRHDSSVLRSDTRAGIGRSCSSGRQVWFPFRGWRVSLPVRALRSALRAAA
jgi:hypothetical protein